MSDTLTWPQFRGKHKELDKERISELWSQYKEGEYDGSSEVAVDEPSEAIEVEAIEAVEEVVEIGESDEWPDGDPDEEPAVIASPDIPDVSTDEVEEPIVEDEVDEPVWEKILSIPESLNLFKMVTDNAARLKNKLTSGDIEEANIRLKHIAKFSRPEDYECEVTDAWTLWMCPTNNCILINTSKNLAFTCTRVWWKENYNGAFNVEEKVVDDAAFLENLEYEYRRKKRFVPRNPLPNVEIKLPRSVREVALRRE